MDEPLRIVLSAKGQGSLEEGLHCLSELMFNLKQVSPRMWLFYQELCRHIIQQTGFLEDVMDQAAVPLINYIGKDGFKTISLAGTTPLSLMFEAIKVIFNESKLKNDELGAMVAVTLTMAILENVTQLDQGQLESIIQYFMD